MLKNPPLIGAFPVTQRFGDNPSAYGDVRCGGVPLRGHNGQDFGAPPGTPVVTVQDGVVVAVGEEPDGFGNYVLVGHPWGQTLYAHLERVTVARQQNLQAGDQVGLVGASGAATAPHLHFGLRIHPFTIDDGWCGYSDPEPYLRRLTTPRGAMIGPHIVGGIPRHLDLLRRWQPRLVLVLDPNPDEIRQLRQACPTAVIVGRIFEPDNVIDERIRANPQEAAAWAHDKCMSRMTPDVDYWQFANEVLQKADSLPLLKDFELGRMRLADGAGYKCAIFAFSVGNPDLPETERMADWEKVYPAIEYAEANRHCIAIHQYGMPNLWGPDDLYDWYIYRLEHQVLRRLPFKQVQFAITEYGIDGLIQGQRGGWQKYTDADTYVNQLLKSGAYVERYSGRILGYAVFTLGHNPPWGSYDISGAVAEKLAARSQRGTWRDVDTTVNDFAHDSNVTEPGGTSTTTPGEPTMPTEPSEPSEPSEPAEPQEPTEPTEPQRPAEPAIERRLTEWFDHYRLRVSTLADRPDDPDSAGDTVYVLKDVFTTYMGSWEHSEQPGSVPQWARDAYLRPEFLEAGADHHLFGAVLDRNGNFVKNVPLRFWSDGFSKLGDATYDNYAKIQTKADSGWANNPMGPGSSYVPERGESGPWCWAPEGAAEVICGGGLPARHHLSTFAVWQEMDRAAYEAAMGGATEPSQPDEPQEPSQPDEPAKPSGPGTGEAGAGVHVERRISPWIEKMNIAIKDLASRSDDPDPEAETIFVVKDAFTTINGSWEPDDKPYSIPQWARDAYLKPWGAPDYFDDAGADHHLFAAVLGADGTLLRLQPVVYWSDGFQKLGDDSYDGYVDRATKERSGWINIPIGPDSSFVPERGESGPWCWAPAGAAEVLCGGGLPAKQHVSTFVVWQEVPRDAEVEVPATGGAATGDKPDGEIGQPVTEPITAPAVQQRISEWIGKMNVRVMSLDKRGDAPPQGDYVYVVKDMFTTHNGSWEPNDKPYSVPQWARESYLKPWGAPDYFDDAGADHHLFAAIIGPDGQLLRDYEVRFWSDGFDKLADPNYDGYIQRATKSHSGWANIPIGPSSSFVPERGESGPWCWAPAGASEVICGGGLPAKQHVSTFVVWQAVARQPDGGTSGDHTIFMPTVFGPGGRPQSDAPPPVAAFDATMAADPSGSRADDLGELRWTAWVRLGFEGGQNSVLAIHAREHKLGMPVTGVYQHANLMVQGYLGGIVFHPKGEPASVTHIDW